ncbi:hypothetical protein LXA43DRAFT_1100553 [Ganoderma leucocontextum]|nr:hypothetical protein LXA43DRAFT_1100553 [Ganoderma leucocontextum]
MHGKISVVPLAQLLDDFLPHNSKTSKAVPNIFNGVTKFATERAMYAWIIPRLNECGVFKSMKFVATPYKGDSADPSNEAIDCGMYDAKYAPKHGATATGEESRCVDWSRLELGIECKLHTVNQDPIDERQPNNEPVADERRKVLGQLLAYAELIQKYQQREYHYVVLFLGLYARVIRFDRSGVVASEKINYQTDGPALTDFLARYCRAGAAKRGHDMSAKRIIPDNDLYQALITHGEEAAKQKPESHAQQLFNKSLDQKWPWWTLGFRDEESGREVSYAVGKPNFYAGGVVGRGTRGYVAVAVNDEGAPFGPFVYLKDAWRIAHDDIQKEGSILRALNCADVPHVPTLLFHGDLKGQTAQAYEKWPSYFPGRPLSECGMKPHQHYRLVVAEVGKPLSEFTNGWGLVWAIWCCIEAHEEACKAGFIHRDISAGNIILWENADNDWEGLLTDWELAKPFPDSAQQNRQVDRTGTWQFMSAHTLMNHAQLVGIPDDLESFFHVLIYFAIRFLPHNCHKDAVGRLLYNYFDDSADGLHGDTVGFTKFFAIKEAKIRLTIVNSGGDVAASDQDDELMFFYVDKTGAQPDEEARDEQGKAGEQPGPAAAADEQSREAEERLGNHPINLVIKDVLKWLQAYYAKDDKSRELKPVKESFRKALKKRGNKSTEMALPPTASTSSPGTAVAAGASAAIGKDGVPDAATMLETHDAMRDVLLKYLSQENWPSCDKGDDMKPAKGYTPFKPVPAPTATATRTSMKRAMNGGETSRSKKSRSHPL